MRKTDLSGHITVDFGGLEDQIEYAIEEEINEFLSGIFDEATVEEKINEHIQDLMNEFVPVNELTDLREKYDSHEKSLLSLAKTLTNIEKDAKKIASDNSHLLDLFSKLSNQLQKLESKKGPIRRLFSLLTFRRKKVK